MILVLLSLLMPLVAGADSVSPDAFPGIVMDVPLQDGYASGEALVLKGQVGDAAKAGGQILFKFTPQSGGADVRVFLTLQGTRFEGYQIFQHEQTGAYDLEVFVGGAGDTRLAFVGSFTGLRVTGGSGPILLPMDFFPGVVLEDEFSASQRTGEEVAFVGRIDDAAKADGQILFNFIDSDGRQTPVYITLDGTRFDGRHIFLHDESGVYELEVYLGGAGVEQLGFVGRFPVSIDQGSGGISIPTKYFTGLIMDRSFPTELIAGRPVEFAGKIEDAVRGIRIELDFPTGEVRQISVGVEDGRFRLPLRLRADEIGALEFRVLVEMEDGLYHESGVFPIEGVEPPPEPRLEVGVLGLNLLVGGAGKIPLANVGDAELKELRYEIEGPFRLAGGPSSLDSGERGEVLIEYDGQGGDRGLLRLLTDDPLQPVRRVALYGLEEVGGAEDLVHARADARGYLEMDLDFARSSYVLVLYAGQIYPGGADVRYPFALGGGVSGAKPAVSPAVFRDARDRLEMELRQRERELAVRYRSYRGRAAKPGAVEYLLGERREFVFPDMGAVPAQRISATVVAVEEGVVAWVQDDLRGNEENLTVEQLAAVVGQFSRQDYELVVEKFGMGSDVDGDGKLSFLFTHLVDDVGGVAGFYSSSSVIPREAGGSGNMMDMMFISPTARLESYRPLLVHEFQHLINFNQHVLVRRGEGEVSWLNEGLSHLSEDLVAGYAVSGQNEIVSAFLEDPSSVGLEGEALLYAAKRGAAYLFVRGLVDRMGEGVLQRLVGTGLADQDNVEEATGEDFSELLAFWGARLYASGLGLSEHPRFNFDSPLLQTRVGRGFPLPAVLEHRFGESALQGSLRPRGVSFVHVQGNGSGRMRIEADPRGEIGAVVLPLRRGFVPAVHMPEDYIPGLLFSQLMPGLFVAGREYSVAGETGNGELKEILFRFVGADTVRFEPEVINGRFTQKLRFRRSGEYKLQVFTGTGGALLDFAGEFGPVRVIEALENTAVGEERGGLPRVFALGRPYPNPFNASSVVPIAVPEGNKGEISLEVYNALGQRVRMLHRGRLPTGWTQLFWDGRDDRGQEVASGVYLYRLKSGDFQEVQPTVLLR